MNSIDFDKLLVSPETEPNANKSRCVVRLTTSVWHDGSGIHIKKTLRYLRKKCVGYNILEEDCNNAGVDDVIQHVINLDECKDGVYQVVTCNEFAAWETPNIVEDYDYKLIPFTENE